MPFLAPLLILTQILFAVHVVRTGRDSKWIYFILFIPAIGCAVYFFAEVLPDLQHSRTVRRVGKQVVNSIDPTREIRRLKDQLEISDTLENRRALADECVRGGLYDEGITFYHSCLKGIDKDNPHIMLALAKAQFLKGDYAAARQSLEGLIANHPDYKSAEGHLLYARTLESLGEYTKALEEYESIAGYFSGEEARCRFAKLLTEQGQQEQAGKVYQTILQRARRSPKYYQKSQKEWIDCARANGG